MTILNQNEAFVKCLRHQFSERFHLSDNAVKTDKEVFMNELGCRSTPLRHDNESSDLSVGRASNALEVVHGTRADLAEENLFAGAAAKGETHLIEHLGLSVQVGITRLVLRVA